MPAQEKIQTLMVMLLDSVGTSKTKSMRKQVFLEFLLSTVESVKEAERLKLLNNFFFKYATLR